MSDRNDNQVDRGPACNCPLVRVFSEVRLSHLGLLVLVFGLLLWARFLLVTGHPRTAIADPPPAAQTALHASVSVAPQAGHPQP